MGGGNNRARFALTYGIMLCVTFSGMGIIAMFAAKGESTVPSAAPETPKPVVVTYIPAIETKAPYSDNRAQFTLSDADTQRGLDWYEQYIVAPETEDPATEPPARYQATEGELAMLAKMVWGEARGLPPEEQALCVWCVLNRLDDGRFGASVSEILTRPHQFVGYKASYPATDEILAVVDSVLEAYANGENAPTLPPYAKKSGYLYFSGDNSHNWFK